MKQHKVRVVKKVYDSTRQSHWRDNGLAMTVSRYDDMLIDQNYCCAICGLHSDEFKQRLSVDHDHSSKEVRGLLCQNCNLVVGHAKDNVWILERAIKYLSCQICLDTLERENVMMNLTITEDVFQCGDGRGGGCGRLFDGLVVTQTRGLCEECRLDLPETEGC